jgi:hypothetical protein
MIKIFENVPWRRGTSPPATEELGAMGREIKSRQSICREAAVFKEIKKN